MSNRRKLIEDYDYPPLLRVPSVGEVRPELVKQWDERANCGFSVYEFAPGSQIHAHWKCWMAPDHRWQAKIANVVISARKAEDEGRDRKGAIGCPFCHGLLPSSTNTLLKLAPAVAAEWHKTKNKFGPEDVTVCSTKSVWWTCPEGHDYRAKISNRTNRQSGCLKCNLGEPIDLREYKKVLREFDRENNPGVDPYRLPAGLKVNWICWSNKQHKWRSGFYRTTKDLRCPECRGIRPSKKNDPACVPHVIEAFETPVMERKSSADRITWTCDVAEDHEWTTTKQMKRTGTQCPFCANIRLSVTNSLKTCYPKVASEWHPTKNRRLTPNQVIYCGAKLHYWICKQGCLASSLFACRDSLNLPLEYPVISAQV
ncbi:MAG: zinc-ribbon domain-containing protein, partial [Candidatus Obscuribacterales bacterium]|nr:zinc-ribbon domain-containing protein [Candidatus Obscuribacterales bacterium]